MIRIKGLEEAPPNAAYWPDGAFPPFCPTICSRACVATQSIIIWYMVFVRTETRADPRTGESFLAGSIFGQSIEYFMDQYGCRAAHFVGGLGTERTEAQARLVTEPLTGDVSAIWRRIAPKLREAGAREPGTITILPTVESLVQQLLRAAELS